MTAFVAFVRDNLGSLAILVGGGVACVGAFLIIAGATRAPPERNDETPTNPKGKL